MNTDFSAMFRQATDGSSPLPYQERLALADSLPSLLDVPTGLGKTAAAILAWVWRRRFAGESIRNQTPRRLVYCLPMRVLVEQTYRDAVKWLDRLGLLAGSAGWTEFGPDGLPTQGSQLKGRVDGMERGYQPDPDVDSRQGWASENQVQGKLPIAVHLLLGGEEKSDWVLWPERDAILIGTQDMLISRALNRGYAAGRARWPQEFGLLNSDCLWVFDEIQIMDISLATSLQLDAWRLCLRTRPDRGQLLTELCPVPRQHRCHSLWMSATMAKHWLERAVDWSGHAEAAWKNRQQLSDTERTDEQVRSGQLFKIHKQLSEAPVPKLEKPKTKDNRADAEQKQSEYLKRLARHISDPAHHAASGLTLIILNTVDRATELFKLLRQQPRLDGVSVKLIHSRFRPQERDQWPAFLDQKGGGRRVLISTQVVEAGVDLSAAMLYTELAPWAALVQRFGRCARYPGETGRVIWLDLDLGTDKQPVEHWARPYERAELVAARHKLEQLRDSGVGLKSVTGIKAEIDAESARKQAEDLFPYEPRFVPRDKDLLDLFDTTPDLTGADVDVSRFIRDGEELDVQVFWREMPDREPSRKDRPQRRELCPVPFHRFREFAREVVGQRYRIWRRRYSNGRNRASSWELLDLGDIDQAVYPGQVFLLQKSCGGYDKERGWTRDPRDHDFDVVPLEEDPTFRSTAQDESDDADDLSKIHQWLSIHDHCRDVFQKMADILKAVDAFGLTESEQRVLLLAARLHDWGKAHPAFTAKLSYSDDARQLLNGQPAAKAPPDAWRKDRIRRQTNDAAENEKDKRRPGHRHELASALAILETLCSAQPGHDAFAWPEGLDKSSFGKATELSGSLVPSNHPLAQELAELSADELDLLVYLVASHHGKVRMSLRSAPDDGRDDVPDPCPSDKRQARGVRDEDRLVSCRLPVSNLGAAGIDAPEVILSLDLMELGLSQRYGASWRERAQLLLERLSPFRLGYLEALLRAADCRASKEEDERGRRRP